MCNIAGYIGERDAAPILIEMIRAQEGLNGGFYTGIATLHEGKIHYRKVVGDLDELLRRTDAASLPGKIGIIHSRTPGDQGDEWAHPFISERDGEITSAQVYNGSIGHFKYLDGRRVELAESLLAEGYNMRSRLAANGKRLELTDGTRVHISDLMCQLIAKRMCEGDSAVEAMEKSYCEIPAEIVGLMLSVTEPEAIVWARINMPMHVGRTDHGIYLASAPQAFPDDAGEPYLLPIFSAGLIRKDGFTVTPFKSEPATVAPLDGKLICRARSLICETLRVEKKKLSELAKSVKPLFEAAECKQNACAAYRVLYELKHQGVLRLECTRNPGVFEGLTAPAYRLWIEERGLLHKMKLDRRPFEMIKSGQKTFELRLYDEKRRAVATGDLVEFDCEGETLTRRVVAIHRFESFAELYASLPLTRCGYTEEDVSAADPRDMELYYSTEKQAAYGVVAIELTEI